MLYFKFKYTNSNELRTKLSLCADREHTPLTYSQPPDSGNSAAAIVYCGADNGQ